MGIAVPWSRPGHPYGCTQPCQVISAATVVKWAELGQEVWVRTLTLLVFLTLYNSVPSILLTKLSPACWLSCRA